MEHIALVDNIILPPNQTACDLIPYLGEAFLAWQCSGSKYSIKPTKVVRANHYFHRAEWYDYIPGNNGHFEKKKRQQENISKEELKENIQSNARVLNISSAFSHLVW